VSCICPLLAHAHILPRQVIEARIRLLLSCPLPLHCAAARTISSAAAVNVAGQVAGQSVINDQLDTHTQYLEHRQLMRPPLARSGGSSRPEVWIHLSGANPRGSNKRASASSALPATASAHRSHGSGGTEPQFIPQRTGRGGAGQPV
jgi:hypothetical protein